MKRKRGRPPYRTKDQLREFVLGFIPEDGERIRWIDLEEKAKSVGVSLSTMRKYLAKLETARAIERQVDPDARPPAVYYRRAYDKYFQGIEQAITAATPEFRHYLGEEAPAMKQSFRGFTESLAGNTKRLHGIKDYEELTQRQGELFLYYANTFLAILSHIFEDYSCTNPPEKARAFLDEAIEVLVKPMLRGMAQIFDPELPRDKYAIQNMRGALFDGLIQELKRYPEIQRALAEKGGSVASETR
jgi:hypothetical protein